MAALCQNEPNTFFCRYIYYNTKFYHINNFAEDWEIEDERRYEVPPFSIMSCAPCVRRVVASCARVSKAFPAGASALYAAAG